MFSNLAVFVFVSLVMLLVPGPAILLIALRTSQYGFRAGFFVALGLVAGVSVLVVIAIAGLSVVLETFPDYVAAIQLLGGLYVIYLGFSSFQSAGKRLEPAKTKELPLGKLGTLFGSAFLVNLLNPKLILYFSSFFPMFIDQKAGNYDVQITTLGIVFIGLAAGVDIGVAALVAWLRDFRALEGSRFTGLFQKIAALLLAALGLYASFWAFMDLASYF